MKEKLDFYSKTSLKSYNLNESMRYQLGMLDSLDAFTRVHSENVANLTCRLCEYMRLNNAFTVYCTMCAYLHDIGKMFIPPSILQKTSALTDEEFEIMKKHTTLGYKMCMDDLKLRPYSAGPIYHHEALNGSGYPKGLTGKDIPLEGQIIRVADEFDAIASKRQYKSHVGISETLKMLVNDANSRKINKKALKCLFKVIIDDTNYEISGIFDYTKHLSSQIKRLEEIDKFNEKMQNAKNENKKEYFRAGMKYLFEDGENFENYKNVLEEYKTALAKRKEKINELFNEIKEIKKLRV
ncbi:MAG: HD domain-containing protein [Clostridia bacterium]|nr:HD domain-containing protein [Clostridia bacterium]